MTISNKQKMRSNFLTIVKHLLKSAIALMNQFKYPQKMAIVCLIFSLPLAIFQYLLNSEINRETEHAGKEKAGIEYIQHVMRFMQDIQQHRGMANAFLNGDVSFEDGLKTKQAQLKSDILEIDRINGKFVTSFKTAEQWKPLKEKWLSFQKVFWNMKAKEVFNVHTSIIKDTQALINNLADIQ